jgi:hypothetical protein
MMPQLPMSQNDRAAVQFMHAIFANYINTTLMASGSIAKTDPAQLL